MPTKTITLILTLTIPSFAGSLSLTGSWLGSADSVSVCGNPIAATARILRLEITEAPLLNRSTSAFTYKDANVTGSVTLQWAPRDRSVEAPLLQGMLIGALVKTNSGTMLEAAVLTEQQFAQWKKLGGNVPKGSALYHASKLRLELSGNPLQGYTLTGTAQSADHCPLSLDLNGRPPWVGQAPEAKVSARVTFKPE